MCDQSICLNMIVKNEADIICDTFDNLLKYFKFSSYIICDTGSTDNTIEIIKNYFNDKGIKGKVHKSIWRDFGYNRTEALEKAFNTSDYLLVFDADDRITGNFKLPNKLLADAYNLILGDEKFNYTRPLLITNRKKWKFTGVLHEYLDPVKFNQTIDTINGDYYIVSGRFGHRSKQGGKYERDAEVFEKAYPTCEPLLKPRYAFYCAQSYKDCNNIEKAVEWYKIRLSYEGFIQEKYYSCLMLGNLLMRDNQTEAIKYFEKSYEIDSERIEGLYYIIKFYREKNNMSKAMEYYRKIVKSPNPNNKLFIFTTIYTYLLDIELSIIGFYIDFELGLSSLKKLFSRTDIPEDVSRSIVEIFSQYVMKMKECNDYSLLAKFFKFLKCSKVHNQKLIILFVSKFTFNYSFK